MHFSKRIANKLFDIHYLQVGYVVIATIDAYPVQFRLGVHF